MVMRMAQHRRAVGDRALAGQVQRGACKGGHCIVDAAFAVGIAEMRHQRYFVDLGQRVEPRPSRAKPFGRKAEPVHARVHLQEHPVRHLRLVRGQHVDLRVAVNGVPKPEP